MISEELKARLEEWCRKHSTRLSRIYYNEEDDNTITVKRYDGQGKSNILHCIKTEKELKDLLDKSDKLDKELNM